MAFIFPSVPLIPKPPGTTIPLAHPNISSRLAFLSSNFSESTQLIFILTLYL